MTVAARRLAVGGVFTIVFASCAYFHQSRDWNTASRLMLTYALVDRGTVEINGYEDQTRDRAVVRGRYYTDKLPGYSFAAVVPYALARPVLGLAPHPLNQPGFPYWPADYWITLGTSGLFTATAAALLAAIALNLGCGPRLAALVGLAYGLGTPAFVYGTLAYGHQATACFLLAAFFLIERMPRTRGVASHAALAGFLASYAAVVELQVGPVSAILGLYLLWRAIRHEVPRSSVAWFALCATIPAILLLGYNLRAFGSPFDMGYFHESLKEFSRVHSKRNPLGLRPPDWARTPDLLLGGYRGLLFYAPVLIAAVPGWFALWIRDRAAAVVVAAACAAVFLVNLSYPEWTGGWSTGPRLLLPLIPFAIIAVAALLSTGNRAAIAAVAVLALAGAVLMWLFAGVGGRVPHDVGDPLRSFVLPAWRGDSLPLYAVNGRFTRNALSALRPGLVAGLPPSRQWLQFAPLLIGQVAAVTWLFAMLTWSSVPTSRRAEPAEPQPPKGR